jgi:hypothetical protein
MKSLTFRFRPALVPAAAALALLAACGGGGDPPPAEPVGQQTAEAMSANSGEIPTDSARSSAELLSATRSVIASGQASQTVACAGGGTAVYTITGGTLASVTNGVLDTGEVYTLQFNACRGSLGAAQVDGTATLTVVSAGGGSTVVDTTTQGLSVSLPRRTLTQSGSSRLSQTVVVNGAATTTTERWTSPQIQLTSVRGARTSVFTLSNVDVNRSYTVTGSTLTALSGGGTYTLGAQLPNANWSITVATQGDVTYDVNGVPTQGAWTITLPNNRIGVSIVPGTVTVTLDRGPDGVIDATWTFSTTALAGEAG